MTSQKQNQIRHHKSKRKNLHRRKIIAQQNLSANKTRAPKHNRKKRQKVPNRTSRILTNNFHCQKR
jgi:hypothetical protein